MDPFVAEIRIFPFNFAPKGWAWCDGQLLPLSQNTALFSLLGTTYGGDGESNFALPDLQGSAPMHPGQGPGLSLHDLGETGGSDTVTLLESETPSHQHGLRASAQPAEDATPGGEALGRSVGAQLYQDNVGSNLDPMAPEALTPAGGDQPHNNMQPYLTFYFNIALQGVSPEDLTMSEAILDPAILTNRRSFILGGAAVVAGSILLRGTSLPLNNGLFDLVQAGGRRISVGYVTGSADVTALGDLLSKGAVEVVPATSLGAGDLAGRAALITVQGFSPAVSGAAYSTVLVDALVPSPLRSAAESTIPFYAFTHRGAPASMTSGPSKIVVGRADSLRIGFRVHTAAAAATAATTDPATSVFTSGRQMGLPKLRRGIYLLGLNGDEWATSRVLNGDDDDAWGNAHSVIVSISPA